jgi:FkbM family methyltransferase
VRYFAQEFPEAIVIGIEPNAENKQAAEINCRDFENVEIREGAIGSSSGWVDLKDGDAEPNSFQTVHSENDDGIPVFTIENIVSEFAAAEMFIVKIDIEGFEEDLFSCNTDWIAECFLLVIELHDWMLPKQGTSGNFLRAVSAESRDFVYRNENVFSIRYRECESREQNR